MTAEQFTYWLQGFMEVANPSTLDERQTQIIKDHLALVFDKKTPEWNIPQYTPTFPVNTISPSPIFPYTYPDTTNPLPGVLC